MSDSQREAVCQATGAQAASALISPARCSQRVQVCAGAANARHILLAAVLVATCMRCQSASMLSSKSASAHRQR